MNKPILSVRDLEVDFKTHGGIVQAVRGLSFDLYAGRTLAIVGESGCGKSVSVQTIMGLIPTPPGKVKSGCVMFGGKDLLGLPKNQMNEIRGKQIGMIFQDPMSSLNPTLTVGAQIGETLRVHENLSSSNARERAISLLKQVRIPEAASRVDAYPFQFSGGMRQRVMIAMALACNPSILIADEPTTALDVTIQAQILVLLKDLQREKGMSMILITHDLGVVAKMADDVAVMYAGQIVESGTTEDIFYRSSHPYTQGLKSSLPSKTAGNHSRLMPIPGSPPDLFDPPKGCAYFDRCPNAMKACEKLNPYSIPLSESHSSRCWLWHPAAQVSKKEPIACL